MKKSSIINKIDVICSTICLIKGNFRCIMCMKEANQTHHYFHKGNHGSVRFHEDNHCPLCYKCHTQIHSMPQVHDELSNALRKKIGGDRLLKLMIESNKPKKMTAIDLKETLQKKRLELAKVCKEYPERANKGGWK